MRPTRTLSPRPPRLPVRHPLHAEVTRGLILNSARVVAGLRRPSRDPARRRHVEPRNVAQGQGQQVGHRGPERISGRASDRFEREHGDLVRWRPGRPAQPVPGGRAREGQYREGQQREPRHPDGPARQGEPPAERGRVGVRRERTSEGRPQAERDRRERLAARARSLPPSARHRLVDDARDQHEPGALGARIGWSGADAVEHQAPGLSHDRVWRQLGMRDASRPRRLERRKQLEAVAYGLACGHGPTCQMLGERLPRHVLQRGVREISEGVGPVDRADAGMTDASEQADARHERLRARRGALVGSEHHQQDGPVEPEILRQDAHEPVLLAEHALQPIFAGQARAIPRQMFDVDHRRHQSATACSRAVAGKNPGSACDHDSLRRVAWSHAASRRFSRRSSSARSSRAYDPSAQSTSAGCASALGQPTASVFSYQSQLRSASSARPFRPRHH